ncbi:hypothetical protein AKJ09_08486 [Labilithrix luteola]|uniref:Deacetylase n=1 Tax=Labilithrix luteola TaxID=1391654 RepID=A0A0K1Q7V4_9BACT|nr:hypothetical protein AKJ09_08486 [Labilithrix luteola]
MSIDTECDKGKGWLCRQPMAFEGVFDGVEKRLQPLFASHRAKPTYLLSPEILRNEACVDVFRRLASSCELGTHLHGEYAEPDAFEPDATSAFQRDYPPEVEKAKLAYLTDLFIRAFDHQPASFRAGRFGVGAASIGILEDLGYAVESSVTPHMDWASSGAKGLAFLDAPTQPYRPDPKEPGRPGNAKILEVPVTIRRRFVNALPWVGKHVDPRWLRPTRGTAESLVRVAEDEIAEARRVAPGRPVILNAMFHNVEIVPHLSPYASSEDEAQGILGRLGALLAWAEREGVSVVGLGDVPEILAR